jgi:hypothetical protein
MGFDRAAPPGARVETVLEWLARDFAARDAHETTKPPMNADERR